MNDDSKLMELGTKVWEFRKQNGFSKELSAEIQNEAALLCRSGVTAYSIGKALGVPRNTITEWTKRFESSARQDQFAELSIVDNAKPKIEIKLSTTIQGCRVEFFGADFSLLQRLVRKMGN
jgi:hypothetical protein